jgi:hypothetical protein
LNYWFPTKKVEGSRRKSDSTTQERIPGALGRWFNHDLDPDSEFFIFEDMELGHAMHLDHLLLLDAASRLSN